VTEREEEEGDGSRMYDRGDKMTKGDKK